MQVDLWVEITVSVGEKREERIGKKGSAMWVRTGLYHKSLDVDLHQAKYASNMNDGEKEFLFPYRFY